MKYTALRLPRTACRAAGHDLRGDRIHVQGFVGRQKLKPSPRRRRGNVGRCHILRMMGGGGDGGPLRSKPRCRDEAAGGQEKRAPRWAVGDRFVRDSIAQDGVARDSVVRNAGAGRTVSSFVGLHMSP